ncbi:sensor histidine kinase [Steroidobacter sp.]|uniref:sensor histidine kinase n=1 Tax=Steroidobacter sp. TaxID=1978227 RepID=UPI001A4FA16D|nr:histidine kinase [Steroidobacter sp.]MBL8267891.1 histidine kinase [Steroidobacter sp.]
MSSNVETGLAARATLAYWACQLLGWGLSMFGQLSGAVSTLDQPLSTLAAEIGTLNLLGLLFTHWLRLAMKRYRWHQLTLSRLLLRMVLVSAAMAIPLAVLMHFMTVAPLWSGPIEQIEKLPATVRWLASVDPLVLRAVNWSVVFFLWMVLYLCITSVRDRRLVELHQSELRRALQTAELRVLKSQLNPHFLFNSLNSVRALIADDPVAAQRAVTQLARTLRYTLRSGQEELVSLERELEIVEDYLELESLRLGERLRIERQVAVPSDHARVPVMLLQTVVENAIKHGIAELPEGGVLSIRAELRDQTLIVEIQNPRPAVPVASMNEGVGLKNAAERLNLLFGKDAGLQLDLSSPTLAVARIRIPQTS